MNNKFPENDERETILKSQAPYSSQHCILCGCTSFILRYHSTTYEVRQCTKCGLGYTWPPVQNEERIQENESNYTIKNRLKTYNSRKKDLLDRNQLRLLEITKLLGNHNGALLDLGCSTGFFLERAQEIGWKVHGVEMNSETGTYARDQLGMDIFIGTLEEAHYTSGEFDVVTAWDVIEHVQDPVQLLKEVKRILRPGGVLALQVPNINSLMVKKTGNYWNWWTLPDHINHFTPQSIQNLLNYSGFEVNSLQTWEPVSDFIENVLTAALHVAIDTPGLYARLIRKFARMAALILKPVIKLFQHNWWKQEKGALIIALCRPKNIVADPVRG
jgi:2-polyprenyl-3-methyl-5-hydroxy-6-metoxy-1,4-benzoquinol methylase